MAEFCFYRGYYCITATLDAVNDYGFTGLGPEIKQVYSWCTMKKIFPSPGTGTIHGNGALEYWIPHNIYAESFQFQATIEVKSSKSSKRWFDICPIRFTQARPKRALHLTPQISIFQSKRNCKACYDPVRRPDFILSSGCPSE